MGPTRFHWVWWALITKISGNPIRFHWIWWNLIAKISWIPIRFYWGWCDLIAKITWIPEDSIVSDEIWFLKPHGSHKNFIGMNWQIQRKKTLGTQVVDESGAPWLFLMGDMGSWGVPFGSYPKLIIFKQNFIRNRSFWEYFFFWNFKWSAVMGSHGSHRIPLDLMRFGC